MSDNTIHQIDQEIDLDNLDSGVDAPDEPTEAWDAFTAVWRQHGSSPQMWNVVRAAYRELRATLTPDDRRELWRLSKAAADDPKHGLRPLHEYGRLRDHYYRMTHMYAEALARAERKRTGSEKRRKSANAAQKRYKMKKRAEKLATKMKETPNA